MNKKLVLLLSGIATIFVVGGGGLGCGQPSKSITPLSISNFPHTDGSRWRYEFTTTKATSEIISSNFNQYFNGATLLPNGINAQNLVVSNETTSLGAKAVKSFSPGFDGGYYYICETGVYYYGSLAAPTIESTLVLPLPLKVGDAWTAANVTYEALAEEEITVTAGTFNTVKVGATYYGGSTPIEYKWYADGVGMVKSWNLYFYVDDNRQMAEGSMVDELQSKNF
jgi:hypothetical protein